MKGVGKRKGIDDEKSSNIRKRADENDIGGGSGLKEKLDNDNNDNIIDGLVFEDPFEDEFEEEDAEEYEDDEEEDDDDDEDGENEDEYEDMDDNDDGDDNEPVVGETVKINSNITVNGSSTDSSNKTSKNNKSKLKATKNKPNKQKQSEKQSLSPAITKSVWRPGVDKLEDDEELEYDPSAYVMYHSIQTEWPCLSFDFIRDDFGNHRQRVRIYCML